MHFQMQYNPQNILTQAMEQEEDRSTSVALLISFPNQSDVILISLISIRQPESNADFGISIFLGHQNRPYNNMHLFIEFTQSNSKR